MTKKLFSHDPISKARAAYEAPQLKRWGTVAELTKVGQTNPGDDVLPGNSRGRESGSRNPKGLD